MYVLKIKKRRCFFYPLIYTRTLSHWQTLECYLTSTLSTNSIFSPCCSGVWWTPNNHYSLRSKFFPCWLSFQLNKPVHTSIIAFVAYIIDLINNYQAIILFQAIFLVLRIQSQTYGVSALIKFTLVNNYKLCYCNE